MTDYELFRSRSTAPPPVSDTEPAPPDRPTSPPSAAEAEAAFRESQRPPMVSLRPGPRSLRSPDPLEPALAEMRGFRDDIAAGFARQEKADRATRREIAKASRASSANFAIVKGEVVSLRDSFGAFRRETDERLTKLEAEVARLAARVDKQEAALEKEREAVRLNREHVDVLRVELEKARADAAQAQPAAQAP